MQTELPDGIYLDLSFEDYLAAPRVRSGNLTDMIEGPAAYWANSPMNPDREECDETEPMKLGRAYHCARLEPEAFAQRYVQEIDAEDMPAGTLMKDADYKAALKELGQAQIKAGETVLERAERLAEISLNVCWHVERAEWEAENQSKTWLSRKHMAEITRDAARIRMNPELAALIEGGMAEVSILWTDEATGIKCKCRPDYLGSNWITHLKTWDMKIAGKPGNRAVVDAFRFNGYYRTGWFYLEGLMAMPGLVFRKPDGTLTTEAPEPLGAAWKAPKRWDHWFLFVRRSGIPDIRAREIMYFDVPRGVNAQSIGVGTDGFKRSVTVLGRKADMEVRRCLQQIAECSELYGRDGSPWFPRDMIGRIGDDDFSAFWLDSIEEPR